MRTNLLPPQAKTELADQKVQKLVIIWGSLVLVFLISLTLILFSVKTYISGQADYQQTLVDLEQKQLEVPEIQNLREKVRLANQNLLKLDSFYEQQIHLTEVFEKISQILPQKMYLTGFSYQKTNSQLSLSGFAPRRETLLEFKKNLEKEFPNPYFPPQNWIKPTDIDFQVSFKISK